MSIEVLIRKYSAHPIPHQVLISLLQGYKRPNDKIHSLINEEKLISLKKGLYVWNSDSLPENFSIANILYTPSYISVESALSFYGLIPERVFSVSSMTFKTSKKFSNSLGNFEYIKIPTPYYSFGIKRISIRDGQFCLMATGEKALMDKVITTPGIIIRSEISAQKFLFENLRMDDEQLKIFNTKEMRTWLEFAPKKESLLNVIKTIENL
ncbi:Transcriptional regulator, AbiEi antitoxin, Type IV TA system [Epilithonimonas lactis]|uniref:Transcriptional regulator, AbiEi antitoxin, Type IV TA system n=1 Tax=Epilithonimonas lactis TaxID=421072 RepID=A0A085BGC2_9FLAO|nr:hypothetical protein IO89_15210 [Epilithonimonas lactis]SEP87674.1 Transcriptional regulator, AbiEi antitoxin, Type IV TA system [Epilithonimonas lactis]